MFETFRDETAAAVENRFRSGRFLPQVYDLPPHHDHRPALALLGCAGTDIAADETEEGGSYTHTQIAAAGGGAARSGARAGSTMTVVYVPTGP